jgi:hypothetical protein
MDRLNRVRARSDLGSSTFAPRQSAEARRLRARRDPRGGELGGSGDEADK